MKRFRVFLASIVLLTPVSAAATTPYAIDFKVTNSKSYGAIDLRINYAAANGGFNGSGSSVSCTTNAALNATGAYNDQESLTQLNAGLIKADQIAGPAVLFTCTFNSNGGAPSASNFVISIYDWSSTTTTNTPVISISRIQAL